MVSALAACGDGVPEAGTGSADTQSRNTTTAPAMPPSGEALLPILLHCENLSSTAELSEHLGGVTVYDTSWREFPEESVGRTVCHNSLSPERGALTPISFEVRTGAEGVAWMREQSFEQGYLPGSGAYVGGAEAPGVFVGVSLFGLGSAEAAGNIADSVLRNVLAGGVTPIPSSDAATAATSSSLAAPPPTLPLLPAASCTDAEDIVALFDTRSELWVWITQWLSYDEFTGPLVVYGFDAATASLDATYVPSDPSGEPTAVNVLIRNGEIAGADVIGLSDSVIHAEGADFQATVATSYVPLTMTVHKGPDGQWLVSECSEVLD